MEDAAITIGSSIDKALGNRSGIRRFGHASVPMDEALAEASVDLVRRQYSVLALSLKRSSIEKVSVSKPRISHFLSNRFWTNMNSCIHVTVKSGQNDHHKVEAAIKSLAVALRQAMSSDPKQKGIPSTKGKMVD